MTPLQRCVLDAVLACPGGISLDDLAAGYVPARRSLAAARASVRDVLHRLGAEGLVESVDAGEHWRRAEP
jgi:Fe2+ or Zn2+ uptake regulation protein